MDSDTQYSPSQLATTANDLMASKLFSLASCVMLFYDIVITFGDEVEKIWKQPFTMATILWYLNRYLSPLGYIVVIVAFNDPNWGVDACNRYVLFPEILKVFTATTVGIIFTLRLYAIYGRSKLVLYIMACLLSAEIAVKIWSFTSGVRLQLPPGFVGCILTGNADSTRFVYTWVAELVFDSCVFIATVSRTIVLYRRHRHGQAVPLIKVMMRDGLVYFAVIFAANVVTVTLFITLPPDLMAINATFSSLITSLMVSRLILNLRGKILRPKGRWTGSMSGLNTSSESNTQLKHPHSPTDKPNTFVGNLGGPVCSFWNSEEDDDGFDYEEYLDDVDVVRDLGFDFADPDPSTVDSGSATRYDVSYGHGSGSGSEGYGGSQEGMAMVELPRVFKRVEERPRSSHGKRQSRHVPPRIVVEVVEDVTVVLSSPIEQDRLPESMREPIEAPSPSYSPWRAPTDWTGNSADHV